MKLINFPNILTCCNLISGCIATCFAFFASPDLALLWIVIGAAFDFFDGMSARALHISSPIGKELDSLADDVTFGVAPSTIIFSQLLVMQYPTWLGSFTDYIPFIAYVMAAFSALRLAKFNLDERQHDSFMGLPTPAAAMVCGSLATLVAVRPDCFLAGWCAGPLFIPVLTLALCFLLVSGIPMFSMKFGGGKKASRLEVSKRIVFLVIVALAVIIAVAWRFHWSFIFLVGFLGYILINLAMNGPAVRK